MGNCELWAVFLEYHTDPGMRTVINAIMERKEGVAMAAEMMLGLSRDEAERFRLMSEYKYEVDMQSKMVYSEREGIKKGLVQGRAEGIESTARNALAEGASIEFVRKITGLDMETIARLKPKV